MFNSLKFDQTSYFMTKARRWVVNEINSCSELFDYRYSINIEKEPFDVVPDRDIYYITVMIHDNKEDKNIFVDFRMSQIRFEILINDEWLAIKDNEKLFWFVVTGIKF